MSEQQHSSVWTVGMEVLVLEGWYDASEIGQITEIDFEQEEPFLITFSDGEYVRVAPEQLSVVPPADTPGDDGA